MPDRHRHDELIRALIFSLIINLLIVFALVAQRRADRPARSHPFVVSIEASRPAFPRKSSLNVRAATLPTAAKRRKLPLPSPDSLPQSLSVAPTIPPQEDARDGASSPVVSTQAESRGGDPLPVTAAEGAMTAPANESAGGTSITGDKIAGDDYTAPERLVGEKPPYPERAARHGWEGRVLLILSIDANGEVEKVGIAESSGYELLDLQARASVGAWRFKPARRNGMAVAETVQLPIIFRRTFSGIDR